MSFGDLKVQDLIYEDSSNNEITVVIADLATKANPTFTGTVTVPTANANDNTTKAASTAYVQTELGDYLTTATASSTYAPKAAPAFTGTATGVNLTLSGDLTVNGTTTTINTTTLQVEDKNIEIGKVSSPSDTTADGGGWTLLGSTNKTFNWLNATDSWTSSEHIEIASGKNLKVDGTTFFVDGTNNRVGIGSASPNYPLDLTGNSAGGFVVARINNTASNGYARILLDREGGSTGSADISYAPGVFFAIGPSANDTNTPIVLRNNNATERMRIDSTGRVGIGCTPEEIFHIKGPSEAVNARDGVTLQHSTDSVAADTGLPLVWSGKVNNANPNYGLASICGRKENGTDSNSASYLQFATNNSAGSMTEKFRIGSAGQLGIGGATYGSSGQVLTSGGASAAPSWTSISAAPEITATVDGSLSAGDAVIVKSTGNIEKVTKTVTVANPITHSSVVTTSGNDYDSRLVYDKLTGYTVRIWWDNSANRAGKMQSYQLSGVTPSTVGSTVQWRSNNTYYVHAAGDGKGRILVTYRDTGDDRSACHLMNIASDGTLTAHGSAWISGTNGGRTYVTYDPDNDLFVVVYVEGTAMYAKTVTVLSGGTAISVGSASSQIDSGYFTSAHTELLHYDEFSNKLVLCGWKSNYLRAISGTVSGTNTSWNSGVNIAGDGGNSTAGSLDFLTGEPETGLMLNIHRGGNNYGSAIGLKVNGNGFTAGSVTNFRATSVTDAAGSEYNPAIGRICIAYSGSNSSLWATQTVVINSSSLALTFGTAEELSGTHNYAREGSMAYDINEGRMMIWARHLSNSSGRLVSAYYGGTTTNMTTGNFVGFSSAAYSNGNTGTVKVTGNTSTHSSLTAGQKYYVQMDGTLGTTADTPSVEAGTALSSTKLLIKG